MKILDEAKTTAAKYLAEVERAVAEHHAHRPAGHQTAEDRDWITVPLLLAIVYKETLWGWDRNYRPRGRPDGRGDYSRRPGEKSPRYHGHGFFQIDIDAWPMVIKSGNWQTVFDSARFAAELLSNNHAWLRRQFIDMTKAELVAGSIAAYNCGAGNVRRSLRNGKGVDGRTAHRRYSRDVLSYLPAWQEWYNPTTKEASDGNGTRKTVEGSDGETGEGMEIVDGIDETVPPGVGEEG